MPDPTEIAQHEEQHSKDNAEKTESPADAKNTADKNAKEARDKAKDVKGQRFENQRLKQKTEVKNVEPAKETPITKLEETIAKKLATNIKRFERQFESEFMGEKKYTKYLDNNLDKINKKVIDEIKTLLNSDPSFSQIKDGYSKTFYFYSRFYGGHQTAPTIFEIKVSKNKKFEVTLENRWADNYLPPPL